MLLDSVFGRDTQITVRRNHERLAGSWIYWVPGLAKASAQPLKCTRGQSVRWLKLGDDLRFEKMKNAMRALSGLRRNSLGIEMVKIVLQVLSGLGRNTEVVQEFQEARSGACWAACEMMAKSHRAKQG